MTTTDRTLCALHGVAHRDGTKAAIACAALTTATAATTAARVADEHLVTVTVEQLNRVRDEQQHLVRQVLPGNRHVTLVNAGLFGEPIADAHDVADMEDYYGSLEVAAIVLTAELRLEQAAGITHINDLPAPRQGRHAAVAS